MNKPEFLYHGSQYYFDILRPQKACGETQLESQFAIYAAKTIPEVIPFALPIRWYPDNPSGKRAFQTEFGKIKLIYGSLNPNGIGYVYKVKSDIFESIDDWQWISRKEIVPLEIIKIDVADYIDTVEFSIKATEINQKLYGVEWYKYRENK